MKQNQNGFSALEGLLVLVIVGLIGFTGWYVYHSGHKADSLLSATSANTKTQLNCTPVSSPGNHTYSDAATGYCLSLPPKWLYVTGKIMKNDQGHVVKDSYGKTVVAPDSIE